MPEESSRKYLQQAVQYLLVALTLLAPLKFGTMLMPGIPQGLNLSVWDLLLTSLPASYFAVASAVILLLALVAYGVPQKIFCGADGRLLLMWLLLPVVSLIGFVDCDSYESGVLQFEYLSGLAAFAMAVAITLHGSGGSFRKMLLLALVLGTLVTALWGAHQYFIGFDEMKKFIAEQERNGVVIHPDIKERALDNRTYATFTFASALAGMFCLSGVLTVVSLFNFGKRLEPVKVSQILLGGGAAILCGGIYLTTKGRGAFLAVILSMAVTGVLMLKSRKLKFSIIALALITVIAGAFYIHYAGRGFASMSERVGYLKSSWEMFTAHPLCGDGWGDFTYHHAQNKNFGTDELAKDPHNILAAFASQCGILGGSLIAMIMLYSLYTSYRQLRKGFSWEKLAIFFGLMAFSLHALMDLDWQVPALMMWYIAVMLMGAYEEPLVQDSGSVAAKKSSLVLQIITCAIGIFVLCSSLHWSIADQRLSDFVEAAGAVPGAMTRSQSAGTVNKLAGEALHWMPYSHSIYLTWGDDAMRRRKIREAEARYNQALQMVPRSHAVYDRLGDLYRSVGNHVRAEEYYQQADKLFPYKKIFAQQQSAVGNKQ